MTKKIYLETLKSVLGRSILPYSHPWSKGWAGLPYNVLRI